VSKYNNLKLAEATMEGDQEVVKRSGRDEPMWFVIHICMEAMLGISLYSYLYLKLAKMLCVSLQQNWRTRGQNRFCLEVDGGWVKGRRGSPNNAYTY
jgi:hypothetical protein